MSISTTETDPVETVYDLLTEFSESDEATTVDFGETLTIDLNEIKEVEDIENAGTVANQGTIENQDAADFKLSDIWTREAPEVYYYWERPFSEKGPGADQPPNVYVWSPTATDTPVFSADGELFDTEATVEIQIWSLDEFQSKTLQNDIAQLLSQYFADNQTLTDWQTIFPTVKSDFREQKPARKTQHYVVSLEVDLRAVKPTTQRPEEFTTLDFALDSGLA